MTPPLRFHILGRPRVVDETGQDTGVPAGKPLAALDASFAGHIIVGSVFRDGTWTTAVGSTHIQEGNRAIVICNSDYLKEVRKLFAG